MAPAAPRRTSRRLRGRSNQSASPNACCRLARRTVRDTGLLAPADPKPCPAGAACHRVPAMADFTGISIRGRVATDSDSDWDELRQPWNLAADQRPAAVALVESADDVAKVIGFAAKNDLKVTAQGTGHGAVSLGTLEETI